MTVDLHTQHRSTSDGDEPRTQTEPDALTIHNLDLAYRVRGRDHQVLRSVSFRIRQGESYGLVGESGCGKSTAALAAVRYLPRNARVRSGKVLVAGRDLMALNETELRHLRANAVSMVYQDPARALNPTLRIGQQMSEIFRLRGQSRSDALDNSASMLKRVQIADPGPVLGRYAHQLSGGMQQRVAIAMALSIEPKLLILDEPTTGLDATVEAEVLDLIAQLRAEYSTSLLFISHNLAVIARMCDGVGVLYAGALVEEGRTSNVFNEPRHPYTVGLLRCLPRRGRRKDHGRLDTIPGFLPMPSGQVVGCIFAPRCGLADDKCRSTEPSLIELDDRRTRCHHYDRAPDLPRITPSDLPAIPVVDREQQPLLRLDRLAKTYGRGEHGVQAVTDVSLEIWPGETLGLVGESGSGKTTFAKLVLGLTAPDNVGSIELDGEALPGLAERRTAEQVKSLQIVFQNPDSALNRSRSVSGLIRRALAKLAGIPRHARRIHLLALTRAVRLADRYLSVRPHQLSGGLKQRVAIARAFAGNPRLVVCDEPTSALDVSVQAAILNLLADLQVERRVSYIFISHDLGTVRYISDRIAVLYLGRLMEIGPAERVFTGPHHPYTEALLSAVPAIDGRSRERLRLAGEIPSAINPPSGCVFHTRCPRKLGEICETREPPLIPSEPGHAIRCHIPAAALGTSELRDD